MKTSQRKGAAGELELLHLLEAHGISCRRNQQGMLAGYRGGFENPDISACFFGYPFHIECKRRERLNLYEALQQAQHDANGKAIPCVIHRRNRKPWTITMTLEDFVILCKARKD